MTSLQRLWRALCGVIILWLVATVYLVSLMVATHAKMTAALDTAQQHIRQLVP
jgi:hypothetical protein